MTIVDSTTLNDQKKLAMLPGSAGPTNPFLVAYLQLCQVSYADDPSTIPAQVQALPSIISPGGVWQCVWGPAQTSDQSNLAFVASYAIGPDLPPTFAAVVTRGTDFDVTDGWGIIEQIWEDVDVTTQVPLPWDPSSPARIAGGTADALSDIQNLTSNNQTVQQFLGSYMNANEFPVLVVTGHSLGGCLTSVIAPWLQNALTGTVSVLNMVPATFAAPTAGNQAFATYFQNAFPSSYRAYNTLDIVPLAWADLSAIDTLYQQCSIPTPDAIYAAVAGFELLMSLALVSYAQPATNQVPLTGTCYATTDWGDEAFYQHHSTTYMTLLGGQSVIPPQQGVTARPRTQSHLRAKFGPLASLPIAR